VSRARLPLEQTSIARPDRWSARKIGLLGGLGAIVLVLGIVLLQQWGGEDRFGFVGEASGNWAYLSVFFLVFGDAICALLPGETTLNTASALAAEGSLDLPLVMLAGAAGAVCGDSALYWIVRLNRRRFQSRIDSAMKRESVATAFRVIGSSAPILLTFGRYVPGLRVAVNATFGLSAYPYRSFLLWSSIGGTLWAVYTCALAYLVGTALAGFPLASAVISGAVTTVAVAVVFLIVRRRTQAASSTSM
jgi:membrane-associated protein